MEYKNVLIKYKLSEQSCIWLVQNLDCVSVMDSGSWGTGGMYPPSDVYIALLLIPINVHFLQLEFLNAFPSNFRSLDFNILWGNMIPYPRSLNRPQQRKLRNPRNLQMPPQKP